jgi:hypothetical protein
MTSPESGERVPRDVAATPKLAHVARRLPAGCAILVALIVAEMLRYVAYPGEAVDIAELMRGRIRCGVLMAITLQNLSALL